MTHDGRRLNGVRSDGRGAVMRPSPFANPGKFCLDAMSKTVAKVVDDARHAGIGRNISTMQSSWQTMASL